jgi:hypothetical protein
MSKNEDGTFFQALKKKENNTSGPTHMLEACQQCGDNM